MIETKIKRLHARTDTTRDEIQALCVELSDHYDNLFLKFCTRLGKSLSAMKIIEHLGYKKVLWSFAQDIHIVNFKTDALKHGIDISTYDLTCWNSYHKYTNEYDIIVIDECDFSYLNHIEFLKNTKWKRFILLSATMDYEIEKLYKSNFNFFKWEINLSQAIKWGVLPLPTIYLKKIILYRNQKKELESIESKMDFWRQKAVEKGWTHIVKKTKKEIEEYISENNLTEKEFDALVQDNPGLVLKETATWEAIQVNIWGGKRKKFFEKTKLEYFEKEKIFQRLKDKRTIFFLPDINYNAKLGNAVSSLEGKKTNHGILEDFNQGKINYVISNKIMVRGVNLYGINYGYFGIIDMNMTSLQQSTGRVLLGISPNIIIPFCAGTKEEKVLMRFLKPLKCTIKYMQ